MDSISDVVVIVVESPSNLLHKLFSSADAILTLDSLKLASDIVKSENYRKNIGLDHRNGAFQPNKMKNLPSSSPETERLFCGLVAITFSAGSHGCSFINSMFPSSLK